MTDKSDITTASVIARHDFAGFVEVFFKELNRTPYIFADHHTRICKILDQVYSGKVRKLIINVPPRYGKTELVSRMFVACGFARNPASKFINLSYSEALVEGNSAAVKRTVMHPLFRRLFGVTVDTERKNTTKEWYTTGGGGLYVAPFRGQITGFGAGAVDPQEPEIDGDEMDAHLPDAGFAFSGALVIDDPLKPDDANSDRVREHVNELFETTIRNRVNSRRTPIIIIMQRLHEKDLCGYLIDREGDAEKGGEWTVLTLPALSTDAEGNEHALWEQMHTVPELHRLWDNSPTVFLTQYQQNPTPKEGLLYTKFKTYERFPIGRYIVKNYTDTADKGRDYTVSVDYREYEGTHECYVIGVTCTDKGMEFTEPTVAEMMNRDRVSLANIESNNGGEGFARNVEKALRKMGNRYTVIDSFTQRGNKQSRINTRSAEVQNMIYYPAGWSWMWPQFHTFATSYRKAGGNAHDDVPDALTGIIEKIGPSGNVRVNIGRTDLLED